MLNQLQRGDEPALLPCRRSGFLRRPYLGGEAARPVAVAVAEPFLTALIAVGTQHRGAAAIP